MQRYTRIATARSMTQTVFFWNCVKLTFAHMKIQANLQLAPIFFNIFIYFLAQQGARRGNKFQLKVSFISKNVVDNFLQKSLFALMFILKVFWNSQFFKVYLKTFFWNLDLSLLCTFSALFQLHSFINGVP